MEQAKFLVEVAVIYGLLLALTAGFAELRGTDVRESVEKGLSLMIVPAILSALVMRKFL